MLLWILRKVSDADLAGVSIAFPTALALASRMIDRKTDWKTERRDRQAGVKGLIPFRQCFMF